MTADNTPRTGTEAARQLFFEALAFLDAHDYRSAELRLRDALPFAPNSVSILTNLSVALMQQGRPRDAIPFAERTLGVDAANIEALLVLARCHGQERNFEASLAACDRIIALDNRIAPVHTNRAFALNGLHRYAEALVSCDKAIALRPDDAGSHLNRANALVQLQRLDEALAACDRALQLQPGLGKAWAARGNALAGNRRYDEALLAFSRAIDLDPELSSAWLAQGSALVQLQRFDEAIIAYGKALDLQPDLADAWRERGNAHLQLNRHREALADLDKASAMSPDLKYLGGERLHARMQVCDWRTYADDCKHLLSGIAAGNTVSDPFSLLAASSSPTDQLKCAQIFAADSLVERRAYSGNGERDDDDRRLRIAYLSPDFRAHAFARLTAELFGHHDRRRFEIIGMSFGPDDGSEIRRKLIGSFDEFIDVREKSDQQADELIRNMNIDIAVDLCGYTRLGRPNILAQRPAEVQVSYLGYPGTMGSPHIDYLIADTTLISPDHRDGYSEKIVYLPESYQANTRIWKMAHPIPERAELALPADSFVFCCFNNHFKITPDVFDVWMRLLRNVDDSVLWLLEGNPIAIENLRREAAARDVSPDRLVFAPHQRIDLHLARQHRADLFLDTFNYGAHTTASDALWAGLPVVTCCGATFASRVGASLLRALDLAELITSSPSDYESLALRLARDRAALAAIRQKLWRNRQTHSLFDSARFTRHLEAGYGAIWERARHGMPPQDIWVAPIDAA